MKFFILIFGLLAQTFYSQIQRFSYEYKFLPDSTNVSDIKTEIMNLDVLPSFSKFYSYSVYQSDSLEKSQYDKEIAATGSISAVNKTSKGQVKYTVVKDKNADKTFLFTRIGQAKFKVLDDRKISWKILPVNKMVGNFRCQKAETAFAGRIWTAWFTTEIPIPDGPYKFSGLPGLIVKMEDNTHSHAYHLVSTRNLTENEIKSADPENNFIFDYGTNAGEITLKDYKKYLKQSREDPNKSIRQTLADMQTIEIEGKTVSVNEYLRNREKIQREKIAKDNNLIELDLLK